ncbi:hypothetical protein D3C80_1803900 [compost metagenome]
MSGRANSSATIGVTVPQLVTRRRSISSSAVEASQRDIITMLRPLISAWFITHMPARWLIGSTTSARLSSGSGSHNARCSET